MKPTETDLFLAEIRGAAEGGAQIMPYDVLRLMKILEDQGRALLCASSSERIDLAFERALEGRRLGAEEIANARGWFVAGFRSAQGLPPREEVLERSAVAGPLASAARPTSGPSDDDPEAGAPGDLRGYARHNVEIVEAGQGAPGYGALTVEGLPQLGEVALGPAVLLVPHRREGP